MTDKRLARRALLAAATAFALAWASGAARAADLTVGANIGNVPWEFQDASGQFVGFEVDLVNEVAKRLGKTAEIENIPFQGLFAAVQSGRIDMAVSSITITEKRLASVTFAQPYYDSDQSLTVTAGQRHRRSRRHEGQDRGGRHRLDRRHLGHREPGQVRLRRHPPLRGAGPGDARPRGRPDRRLHQRHPGPALLHQGQAAVKVVERIPTGEKYSIMFAKDAPLAERGQRDPDRR